MHFGRTLFNSLQDYLAASKDALYEALTQGVLHIVIELVSQLCLTLCDRLL